MSPERLLELEKNSSPSQADVDELLSEIKRLSFRITIDGCCEHCPALTCILQAKSTP